jgi:hemerythrin-like metal-binding protein
MPRTRSTADVAIKGPFKAHGEISYRIEGRILRTTATGPFNNELVGAIPSVIKELIAKLARQGKWGQIITFQRSALCSISAIDDFAAYLMARYANTDGKPVVALVLPCDVEGGRLMASQYLKCYLDTGIVSKTFVDDTAALSWVESMIQQSSEEIAWNDSYKVGDAAMDEQHQELFMRAAAVIAATTSEGQALCAMRMHQYARTHFGHEESQMHRLQYPDMDEHVRQHLDLISRLEVISKNIANGNFIKSDLEEFIAHWLLTHIAKDDKKFARCLEA